MGTIDIVCAWCKGEIDTVADRRNSATSGELATEGPRISHGMCRACYEAFMAQLRALPAPGAAEKRIGGAQ